MFLPKHISLLAVAGLLALAGCGGSGSSKSSGIYGDGAAATPAAKSQSGGAASVKLAKSGLGRILVDGQGRTLYLFEADKGPSSTCSGACAAAWPPLTTSGTPVAGTGITASKLSTSKRSDGAMEVTYNGHPLYTYAGDQSAGQTNGQGSDQFGAEWYVLSAAGQKVEHGS